ncbi:Bartonella effector protein Bep4 [Bartonella sp. CDC_skunk]|uniref:BID domain-containing T4SS effector n=1 Tax=Bartonella sp. CDC_skunk TaxID=1933905 RepID=UPI0009996501|nr:BID domain-containing T4SS effector [Bartonella sp. CDC_skunk]AQX21532.1 Bartonella effector protein Bep4 [Bartonella sp. CDC_skunk]
MFKSKKKMVSNYETDYATPQCLIQKRREVVNSVISAHMIEGYTFNSKTLGMLEEYANGDYSLQQFNTQFDNSVKKLVKVKAQKEHSSYSEKELINKYGMLVNKCGITNTVALRNKIAHDVAKAIVNLSHEKVPEQFDTSYLKRLHKSLFGNIFDWAGKTRDELKFSDSRINAKLSLMGKLSSINNDKIQDSEEIQESLQKIDNILFEKDNLRGLSSEEFAHNVARMFSFLNYVCPFVGGNECTQKVFFEQLAKAVGYKLDFSVVTKERMKFVSHASETLEGDIDALTPMEHLFEDISDPNKVCMLKEFVSNNKYKDVEKQIIVAARKDAVYNGIYRGCSSNSVLVEIPGCCVVCHKDCFMPEELQALKLGDTVVFKAVIPKVFEDVLIPKRVYVPLTREEIAEEIKKDFSVQRGWKDVESYSKLVYNNSAIFKEDIELIGKFSCFDRALARQFAKQLAEKFVESPQSISGLAGFKMLGMKSLKRKEAEASCAALSDAIVRYADIVISARDEILRQQEVQSGISSRSVKMPSKEMQDILNLPEDTQKKMLEVSPSLRQECCDFMHEIMSRLSLNEYKALDDNNYAELSESLGVSESKAKQIITTVKVIEKLYLDVKKAFSVSLSENTAKCKPIKL